MIRPAIVDLDRVLAHHAISLIYRSADEEIPSQVYSYDLEVLDQEIRSRGSGHLAVGRLRARSQADLERGRDVLRGRPLRRARFSRRAQPEDGAGGVSKRSRSVFWRRIAAIRWPT